jgi:hypothetical protein
VNTDGSRFTGNLRRWRIETVTGSVVKVRTTPVVSTSWTDGTRHTTTTIYETIRLALPGGRQTDMTLVDFNASPSDGDLLTVCVGRKRSKSSEFAVLNHTTGQQVVHVQNLFALREGGTVRQIIFVFGFIFGSLLSVLVAVFGGAPWLIAVWLGLAIAFVLGTRREASMDTRPLWRRGSAEIQPLRA